ncbi:hypothetical protein [Peribacillus frigoritolerans]|uniref:hypothetical protein n=1 Tax=Peribacillus frigoritolerans TaxID=450367 RepID=UPI0033065FD6
MKIPLNGWDEFREDMQPFIDQAYRKEITMEQFKENYDRTYQELVRRYAPRLEIIGWLGGERDDFGVYENKKDAIQGITPTNILSELLDEFKGKKVKLSINVIED